MAKYFNKSSSKTIGAIEHDKQNRLIKKCPRLFWVVFWLIIKISFTAFGGGNALLPTIKFYVIDQYGWVDDQEFEQIIITSNIIPGANVIQVLSYIAIKKLGLFLGTLVTFVAILPHIFLAVGVYYGFSYLEPGYLYVINVAIIIAIVAMLLGFGYTYLKKTRTEGIGLVNLLGLFSFTLAFCLLVPAPFNAPVIVILGLIAMIFVMVLVRHVKTKKGVIPSQ